MKWNTREVIAVALAIVVVGGFFYLFNRPVSTNIVDSEARDNVGAPLSGFQALIERGGSELVAEDLIVGDGDPAATGDELTVHYVGILPDGTPFDSSVERGQPFSFTLGSGQVIDGWDRGLAGMREGGRRVLIIPPELGYGERGAGAIPPGATLIFEVLLLDIQ